MPLFIAARFCYLPAVENSSHCNFCRFQSDDIVTDLDPRRGQTTQPTAEEVREKSERKRQALLDFISDLDAASGDVVVCDEEIEGGRKQL